MDTKLSNITGPIYASNAIASPSLAELPRTATGKLRHETRPITVDNPDDAHEPDTTDYVAFGDLYLPANPAGWSIAQVCAWVGQNGGTEDMLAFLSGQEIDGKALLRLRADEFDFTTMGRRIRFEEAVEKLKRIHEEYGARMEATRDPDAEPPLYQL
ncbi:hypothetical protein BC830DRAFT_69539 [Chytriomyces sp. MP71]|nr:hypothetical protein BC830DRAFT_69539 [Chytriomyces sp. MP71]